jgi:asparagine synthase (glutamine-hydrolysing)
MGAIAGILSSQNHDLVPQMLERIRHRGTTEPEVWNGPNAALGALGIPLVDQSTNPIETPSGTRAIVWDGWIVNGEALRETLAFHELSGDSDAETVLHLYEEQGTNAISNLDGEFALAIVEGEKLLLARDRLGICPLYYGFHNGTICFASEAKALINVVDRVYEFPVGCFLTSERGLYPYQHYVPEPVQLDGAQDSAERLRALLQEAVVSCIPEGVDVGVWLSGGVDSSVIAALARQNVDRLYTFSVGADHAPDLEYAEQVARHIGAEYHSRVFGLEEMLGILDKVIYHLESFDALLVRSAIGNYLVAELASNHVSFVLSGEGGDELFAGYAYQKECSSEIELTLSVQEAISSLHNTALQRVDRSAAAHKTKAGLPFLDPRVVRYALAIPSRWKIRGPQELEKWPLRQAMAEILPDEVVWREKIKFWLGTGAADLLEEFATQEITDGDFEKERDIGDGLPLRSKEELLYYRIFRSHFNDRIPVMDVGRTRYVNTERV